MRYTRTTLTSLIVLSITACATAPLAPATRPVTPATKIGPGDRLRVSIFEWKTPGLYDSIEFDVDSEGSITLPDIGKISAAGLTTAQLESKISQAVVDHIPNIGIGPPQVPGPDVKVEIIPHHAQSVPATLKP